MVKQSKNAEYFDRLFVRIVRTLTYYELKQLDKMIAEELKERGE